MRSTTAAAADIVAKSARSSGSSDGWKDFIAGSHAWRDELSGCFGHPLDTIKVRMQISGASVFRGPVDCLVKTVKSEGVRGLYKGMASPLVGIAAVNSLLFWAYESGKRLQTGGSTQATLAQVAIAGAGAGAINSTLASPVELFKIQLQAQYGGGSGSGGSGRVGPIAVARQVWAQHGVRGVMWGFWATVAREIPAYAAFYAGFEATKRGLAARGHESAAMTMVAGAAGGVSYWTASYPLDVIKSRVQGGTAPPRGAGHLAAAAHAVYCEHGARGFLRGFGTSVVRSVPAAATTFVVYDAVQQALRAA
ncbi:hypothetical protein GGI07_004022 [Coemansia sp. Benny D115]|nr:hypothetical protein GGI07_004022 [Coemansia sp. Benny D115]